MQKPTVAGALACALFLACSTGARALELLREENPPLNYTQEGKPAGVASAVVLEMARRAGMAPEVRFMPWSDAFARARDGEGACVYSTARNQARFPFFHWIGPIARSEYSAYALEGFRERFQRVEDMRFHRVGAVNDARADYLKQRGFTKVMTLDKDEAIASALTVDLRKFGGVDLWVTHQAAVDRISAKLGIKVKMVFSGILSQDYWLACGRKTPQDAVKPLQDALRGMDSDGTLRKLQAPATPR